MILVLGTLTIDLCWARDRLMIYRFMSEILLVDFGSIGRFLIQL